jgi:hemin uptake protein HemP
MRKLVLAAIVASAFFACTGPSASDMKKQNDSLYMVSIEKDRQMNELIGALVEIDDNLQQIKEKENVIALNAKRKDNTSSANVKEKINNDIKAIYDLMLKNKERIAELEKKLQTGNKNNESLRKLVVRLNKQLESKAVEIAALEEELKKKHIQIQHMNFTIDGLQHALDWIHAKTLSTERKLEETTEELFRAYYAFGTRKELKEQNILTGDGFMSKKKVLESDFDKDYFTQIDTREVDSIPLYRPKAKILTTHPQDSYTLEKNDEGALVLKITDKDRFWSTSKYLVIQVN